LTPDNGLADRLDGDGPDGVYLAISNAGGIGTAWSYGGPLELGRGVSAYYLVSLFIEDPCYVGDGEINQFGKESPPCIVGDVQDARS
jgi:hypothetical protein